MAPRRRTDRPPSHASSSSTGRVPSGTPSRSPSSPDQSSLAVTGTTNSTQPSPGSNASTPPGRSRSVRYRYSECARNGYVRSPRPGTGISSPAATSTTASLTSHTSAATARRRSSCCAMPAIGGRLRAARRGTPADELRQHVPRGGDHDARDAEQPRRRRAAVRPMRRRRVGRRDEHICGEIGREARPCQCLNTRAPPAVVRAQERRVATRSRLPSGSTRSHSRPASPSSSTGIPNSSETASMSLT